MAAQHVIGIDVGTGSARAGVFDLTGRLRGTSAQSITLHQGPGVMVEQSGNEIWRAVCGAVRGALHAAALGAEDVRGIGVDATCSLVVLGEGGRPLAVGPSEDPERNVIVWMDHRAVEQAERINARPHDVLRYVGGRISPEMETPKLLWLKEHRPEVFARAWQFMDLTDYLSWRASGDLARSTCTVTCKWTYLAHESRWDAPYFRAIGLGELVDEDFARIGQRVVAPGTALGQGLTAQAAEDLGLRAGTPVAAGVIDAHAGGIGTVGVQGEPSACLAYVFGTSSCTMTTTADPVFVPGVWGPYYSAMVPGTWLNEGGQSVAGAGIEQLLSMHPLAPELRCQAQAAGQSLPALLSQRAVQAVDAPSDAVQLARGLHVVPEFLGNRAPFADPQARAIVSGLGMDNGMDSLVALYVAGVCGIAYGLRQIIEAQAAAGAVVRQIAISGGAGRGPLVRQLLADATGKPVIAVETEEPVLLGAAMLGSVAGGAFDELATAMARMSRIGETFVAQRGAIEATHAGRYRAFCRLQVLQRELREGESAVVIR